MDMYFENPNPNPNPYHYNNNNNIAHLPSSPDFINLSDYLVFDDVDEHQECWSQSTETGSSDNKPHSTITDINVINQGLICDEIETSTNNNSNMMMMMQVQENTSEVNPKVTFRTKSQLEIMDDGYKWRKYGKKSVKNSPYPRNYYKCSGEGCVVKKRVERDREDSSYVLTSYEGIHNHETPCTSYCTPVSLVYSNEWPLHQPSATSSSN